MIFHMNSFVLMVLRLKYCDWERSQPAVISSNSIVLLDLFLEAALLQQLVCLIQNKQSDAGGGQHAQLDKLLDTTCVCSFSIVTKTQRMAQRVHKQVTPPLASYQVSRQLHGTSSDGVCPD